MQTSLTVIMRASNPRPSLLSKSFPLKEELNVEVSASSPWRSERSTVQSHLQWEGSCSSRALGCMVRSSRKHGFICPTFKGIKLKNLKIRTHFTWWAWMYPRSSNTCISPMLWPMLVWLPPSLKTLTRTQAIDLPKSLTFPLGDLLG